LSFINGLKRVSPNSHPERFSSKEDRLAYWINAYNAFVLKGVVDVYPVKSVRDIKVGFGFFNLTYFVAGEKQYTLAEIEHSILRKQFIDPRMHVAINCASRGCPKLSQVVFQPKFLEEQLDEKMRVFLSESRNFKINKKENIIYLSKIFKWFETDFTGWYKNIYGVKNVGIKDFLMLYLFEEDRRYFQKHPNLRIQYLDYDWALNDQAIE